MRSNGAEVLAASRGCYARCAFCDIVNFYRRSPGARIRVRNPAAVASEFAELAAGSPDYVMFVDDDFLGVETQQRGWTLRLVREMTARNAHSTFFIQSRVNDLDPTILSELRKVGLRYVGLGVESNCRRALRDFRKGTTPEMNSRAVAVLKSLRLQYNIFLIPYDPFTTPAELRENVRFLSSIGYADNPFHLRKPVTSFEKLKVFPGTEICRRLGRDGLLTKQGFRYEWEFRDENMAQLFEHVQAWRTHVSDRFLACHPVEIIRRHRDRGSYGSARRAWRLGKEFLELDLAFLDAMITLWESGSVDATALARETGTWQTRAIRIIRDLAAVAAQSARSSTDATARSTEPGRVVHSEAGGSST